MKETVFEVERVGSFLFGTSSFGVHLNGYTFVDGEMKMWIARRSPTKQTWPGMLDNMVY
jgi:phosphoribosylaminoimidazole (AIR) synthetase